MASWRHISFLLSFLGLFAACAILGMLYWMTATMERIEQEKSRALINLKVSETLEAVRLGVEDYAYWTYAYDLVQAQDDAGVFEDLGTGATDSDLFDQLFILNSDGDLQYAFDEDLREDAHNLFDEAAYGQMLDALGQAKPQTYKSVGSVLEVNGKFAFVVAAWITPDSIVDTPNMPLPALIGVVHFGDRTLEALINEAQLSTATITRYVADGAQRVMEDAVTIYGLNDQPVAVLNWTGDSIGASLRQDLLPVVLIATLCIIFICGSAARYFHSQHSALRTANKVAITDQLTGLLNRAGLAEKLRTRDIRHALEKGHLATIYLDLNKFKELNDTFGHKAGDIALRVTAERLQSAVRKSDLVVRLGGDEFLCVVMDENPESTAITVAQRILKLAESPITFGAHQQVITPSAGLAVAAPGTQWETVLSQSDAAMYWAKEKDADRPIIFCKSMDDAVPAM